MEQPTTAQKVTIEGARDNVFNTQVLDLISQFEQYLTQNGPEIETILEMKPEELGDADVLRYGRNPNGIESL